jgi:hypothetical protein
MMNFETDFGKKIGKFFTWIFAVAMIGLIAMSVGIIMIGYKLYQKQDNTPTIIESSVRLKGNIKITADEDGKLDTTYVYIIKR